MGKSQRDKGYRGENNLRKLMQAGGIECKRVPLSGGAPGYPGDLLIGQNKLRGEVKLRGNGFKELYDWLANNDFLFVKADRQGYLAVMRVDDFIKLISGGEFWDLKSQNLSQNPKATGRA